MIKLLPLSLDAGEFPKNHIIAYRLTGQSITWAEILTRLTFWQAELRNIKREKVAVYHSDSVEFLCIVLTLWQMGKIPVIPTNQLRSCLLYTSWRQPEFLCQEQRKSFALFVTCNCQKSIGMNKAYLEPHML